MRAPSNTFVIDKFSDLYEKAMTNKKIMDEGRSAALLFKKMGWLQDASRTKTGRVLRADYGKKRK